MKRIFTIIALVHVTVGIAQKRTLKAANLSFQEYNYADAIEGYLKVVRKTGGSGDLFKKLGDSYYFMGLYSEANKWYGELFSAPDNKAAIAPIYYLRYLQSAPLDKGPELYRELSKKGMVKEALASTTGNALVWLPFTEADCIAIEPLKTSSRIGTGIPTTFLRNGLLFSSMGQLGKRANKRDNMFALYEAGIDSMGNMQHVREVRGRINGGYHVAGASLSGDSIMYFSRNLESSNKKDRIAYLKLYRAKKDGNGKWMGVKELPFNGNGFSSSFPALSPDGKRLYFSSDRPGSVGSSDIYYVDILENGNYGEPVNLVAVNTIGRESFLYIDSDGTLYFSSDGYTGEGGLDVYAVKPDVNGNYSQVINLGREINGSTDDFGFIYSRERKIGFFSSDSYGVDGDNGIYMFTCCDRATIEVETKDHVAVGEGETKNGIRGIEDNALPVDEVRDMETDMGDQGAPNEITELLGLSGIYFDFDSYTVNQDSKKVLDSVSEQLKMDSAILLEIRGYTDRRGSMAYNDMLAQRRARSVIDFLVNKGIAKSRLHAKEVEERDLPVKCDHCTEEDHAKNRTAKLVVKNNVFYTVQLGAFKNEEAAWELMNVPDNIGNLNVRLVNGSLYRVYSGVFSDKQDADAHRKEMQRKGHKDAFVKKLINN